ncbi:MAG: PaaI family thioesterase [Hyphomicrobiales bacterium]
MIEELASRVGQEFSDSPSPLGRWLHGRFAAIEHGAVAMTFEVREEFTNPMGFLHGGIIAAIADDMIGTTIMASDLARKFMSLNLDVQYLGAAKLGDTITASTKLVEAGKRIIVFDWFIHAADGGLLARGTSQIFRLG